MRCFPGIPGLLVAVALVHAPPAHAQPGLTAPALQPAPTAEQKQPPAERRRYGWQIFLADLSVVGVAVAVQRAEPLLALWGTGPVAHGAHGRGDAAVQSFLLRLIAPAGGGFLMLATCDGNREADGYGCLGRLALGFGLGSLTALTIDYFVLARETRAESAAPAGAGRSGITRIEPAIQLTPTSSTAGVRLSF
jgi:hypothetical protein